MKTLHIIIAFCFGLLIGHLVYPGNLFKPEPSNTIVVQTQKEIDAIDSIMASGDSLLKKRNQQLSVQLNGVNQLLARSKSQLEWQRACLSVLSSDLTADTARHPYQETINTGIQELNSITDSLVCEYETKVALTENQVAVRDSALVMCERSYADLKSIAIEQALREQKLQNDLNSALRQQKRCRLQNRFLAAGMLVISGITTGLIVKARQ